MTTLQALILGIVQGITEFLPVSSSGHLVLFQEWFGLVESQLTFNVLVHAATMGAIVVFFRNRLIQMIKNWWPVVLVGTIPAGIVGVLLKDGIEQWFSQIPLVAVALLVTGVINLLIDRRLEKKVVNEEKDLKWRDGLVIGLLQAVAIIPGISRSGSTVFMGLQRRLSRQQAFEFSFMLALPAIGGATFLQLIDIWQQGGSELSPLPALVGMAAAFVTGYLSLRLLRAMMQQARFELFAWYCFVVGSLGFLSYFFI